MAQGHFINLGSKNLLTFSLAVFVISFPQSVEPTRNEKAMLTNFKFNV